jgi:uncharacterized protein (TIGR04255 family)
MTTTLRHPPLVEAILELRWQLKPNQVGLLADPNYSLIVGKIHERIGKKYPEHVALPSLNIPPEMAPYVVQHQFRTTKDGWPLCQIGSGILTYNDIHNDSHAYLWDSFHDNARELLSAFFESYSAFGALEIEGIYLRYINALEEDFSRAGILKIINEVLSVKIEIPPQIFEKTSTKDNPFFADFRVSYPHENPLGVMEIRVTRGTKNQKEVLFVELGLRTGVSDIPQTINNVNTWIDQAHSLTDCLFNILFNSVMERFQ